MAAHVPGVDTVHCSHSYVGGQGTPFQAPQSLSDDEVDALTAYILALNGIIDEDEEMNARALARVRMPNRDGFILAYPERADR